MPPLLLFFCLVGDSNPLSGLSRWCTTTCLLWATQSPHECSKKPPTQTSAVWSVSTVVSAHRQGPPASTGRSLALPLKALAGQTKMALAHPLLILCLCVYITGTSGCSSRLRLSESKASMEQSLVFLVAWNTTNTHASQPQEKWVPILHPVSVSPCGLAFTFCCQPAPVTPGLKWLSVPGLAWCITTVAERMWFTEEAPLEMCVCTHYCILQLIWTQCVSCCLHGDLV